MTSSHDLLDQLRREWRRHGRTPAAQRAAETFRDHHPTLALHGVLDLCDLVAALDRHGGRTVDERAAIVAALLSDARDPQLHRALLQTLLPGVVSVCRQLRFGDGVVERPSDLTDEAIVVCSELLQQWAGQVRPYAGPDVLSALRGRLRRWLLKEKASRQSVNAVDTDRAANDDDGILRELRAQLDGEHAATAALVYARVYEDTPLRVLAQRASMSPTALQGELRQFALQFLL